MKTINTTSILAAYSNSNPVKMRGITSKYRDAINEVKFYIQSGWDKVRAIDFVLFGEMAFMFSDSEDRDLLKNWMLNKMA